MVLLAAAFLMVFASTVLAVDYEKVKPMPEKQRPITGEEVVPDAQYFPTPPGMITDSPGEIVGTTQYDYQTNGSTGERIRIDSQAHVHVSWMKGMPYPATRNVYYNCKTSTGWEFPGSGTRASHTTGGGYTTVGVLSDDRGIVFYHRAPTGGETSYVAIDAAHCLGGFSYARIPGRIGARNHIWPYGTIDRTGRVHVVSTHNAATGAAQEFIYNRSTDGGITWTSPTAVDTLEVISPMITSSRVSDKVAIGYTHSADTTSQWNNDLYYVESTDGLTWDFAGGKINVTDYSNDDDSLWAYTDIDAVYDYNDNLHFIWNAQYVTDAGIYYSSQLFHYDRVSGLIHQIAQFDSLWPSAGCEFGVWNWAFAKFSIAHDNMNNLYVSYTSWDTTDCSAGGYGNGDIYLRYSTDVGQTWSAAVNLTDSHTPNCNPGTCDSDHWSSMNEFADTALHIFYVNDKDAGGIPQSEGQVTESPMRYLTYVPDIMSGVRDSDLTPKSFALSQNYPNPFNANTNIEFELKKGSNIELAVYDITGAKVATLLKGHRDAGRHQISWDAGALASGVYYYTLRTNGLEQTKKMTLLK
jgi:hypothetical protein